MIQKYFLLCVMLACGILSVLSFACALSGASHYVPREPIAAHIHKSIPLMNHFRRSDTFTECLAIGTAIMAEPDLAHGVFGFDMLAPLPTDPGIPHDHALCASLRALVNGETAAEIGTVPYTRYWNGCVSLMRFFLVLMPFIYAYVIYALLTLAGFGVWGYALRRNGLSKALSIALPLICIWGGGFLFFAGNLAHSPAFFVPVWVLALFTLRTRWWEDERKTVFTGAVIGGLTFYFDMLFEAIPFNLLMLALTCLLLKRGPVWRTLIFAMAAFAISGPCILLIKVLAIGLLSDASAVTDDFMHQLFWRMSMDAGKDGTISYARLFLQHLPGAAGKVYVFPPVYWLTVAAGVALFIKAFLRDKAEALPYLLLALVPPVWFFVFPNHSWIHGTFSLRLLFWPQFLGLMACLAAKKNPPAQSVAG